MFFMFFLVTGCDFQNNSMENIDIYTTNYASEYITKRLYGEHAHIYSIYPNGVDIDEYQLTNKQINDYSKNDLYIFNGLNAHEKKYARKMREKNNKLKIIDTSLAMEYNYGPNELWLDPSNFLMMAQNIKSGFGEYIDNYYLNNEINKNYEELKIEASNLDAKIKKTVTNADDTNVLVTIDDFKFLSKYGLSVFSVSNKNQEQIIDIIKSNNIKYVLVDKNKELDNKIEDIITENNLSEIKWNTLSVLNEKDKNGKQDYFSLMNENIDNLKNKLYD